MISLTPTSDSGLVLLSLTSIRMIADWMVVIGKRVSTWELWQVALSNAQPLYLEGGLFYTEKGGKKDLTNDKKMTYNLNYIEIPLVLKYKYNIDPHFSLQPFFGGYFALGVGGKIKNFEQREAQNSFNDDNFRRVDGGLRLGCGVQYDMVYADLTYDIGLANICHDTFDTSHNGGLQLNFGVNF